MRPKKVSLNSHRKDEHLALAQMFYQKNAANDFDYVHLIRPTLPEKSVDRRVLQMDFFGMSISAPFYINAMTGGSEHSLAINRSMARVAAKTQIPLALGSASILAKEPDLLETFYTAREHNPEGPMLLNVNPNVSIAFIQDLIKQFQPIAIQVHVNAVQEIIMPEGGRDFHWLNKLKAIKDAISLPVIVKEVGFGFDLDSLKKLMNIGVAYVDLGGSGGTNFAQIENWRRPQKDFSYLDDVGLSTVKSLLNAQHTQLTYFASGGIRNPLDILKSLVLGAQAVGVANTFLHILQTQDEASLLETIQRWQEQLADLFALYGIETLTSANALPYYLDNELVTYKNQILQ